jgi:uncharacterized protein
MTIDLYSTLGLRRQYLLAFIAEGGANRSNYDLDPIRIMKGTFIFNQEAPGAWLSREERYRFEPYDYGPYSPEVYSDLSALVGLGLVRTRDVLGQTWKFYSATEEGERYARSLVGVLDPAALGFLRRVREFVTKLSFTDLLKAVYQKYPSFAVNSVFRY